MSDVNLHAVDEEGRELYGGASGTGKKDISYMRAEFQLKGNEHNIKFTPVVYDDKGQSKLLKDQMFEIDMK